MKALWHVEDVKEQIEENCGSGQTCWRLLDGLSLLREAMWLEYIKYMLENEAECVWTWNE